MSLVPIGVYILAAAAGYLLGSIPTGFLVAKARGIDIRKTGSGNIGATNVFRALGIAAGIFVLMADALKGWSAAAVLPSLLSGRGSLKAAAGGGEWLAIVAGFCAILGHNYTCWLGFKGGKGIATSAGVLVALVPFPLLLSLSVWLVVFALSRYVSLASICAAFVLPFITGLMGASHALIGATALMAGLAIYKHKSNIQRLLNGSENRFRFKRPPATAPEEKQT